MPGRSTNNRLLRYVGVAVAVVAIVGTVAFGWEFGETNDPLPLALGLTAAAVAVGWTLYRRVAA